MVGWARTAVGSPLVGIDIVGGVDEVKSLETVSRIRAEYEI